jgi:phage/plasmid primase-like uncharacterized protein
MHFLLRVSYVFEELSRASRCTFCSAYGDGLSTVELSTSCSISSKHCSILADAGTQNTSRMFSNSQTAKTVEIERESPTGEFAEVADLVSGKRGREVLEGGNVQGGVSRFLLLGN